MCVLGNLAASWERGGAAKKEGEQSDLVLRPAATEISFCMRETDGRSGARNRITKS